MYRLVRPLLYLLPPELAHRLSFGALRVVCALPGVRALLRGQLVPAVEGLRMRAFGVDFPTPIGLAAGFDKDAVGFEALGALGFGFVEVGTLTARPQPGNPRPRLFRLPKDRALINRMGFNNDGADAAALRLSRLSSAAPLGPRTRPRRTAVGVNVGKTKIVEPAGAIDDYRASTRVLGPHADYFVVNVSSPNTPGLRDLQAVDKLRPLLAAVRETLDEVTPGRRVPLLVKIAPDLADEDIDAVADLALELGLDGIIATNTTVAREGLRSPAERVARCGAGGLSGAPLRERSVEVLVRLRRRVGDRLVLVSAGGLESASDAWARIRAGATLVQLYTAFIYEGPLLPSRLARGLWAHAQADGFPSVQAAVGVEAAPSETPTYTNA